MSTLLFISAMLLATGPCSTLGCSPASTVPTGDELIFDANAGASATTPTWHATFFQVAEGGAGHHHVHAAVVAALTTTARMGAGLAAAALGQRARAPISALRAAVPLFVLSTQVAAANSNGHDGDHYDNNDDDASGSATGLDGDDNDDHDGASTPVDASSSEDETPLNERRKRPTPTSRVRPKPTRKRRDDEPVEGYWSIYLPTLPIERWGRRRAAQDGGFAITRSWSLCATWGAMGGRSACHKRHDTLLEAQRHLARDIPRVRVPNGAQLDTWFDLNPAVPPVTPDGATPSPQMPAQDLEAAEETAARLTLTERLGGVEDAVDDAAAPALDPTAVITSTVRDDGIATRTVAVTQGGGSSSAAGMSMDYSPEFNVGDPVYIWWEDEWDDSDPGAYYAAVITSVGGADGSTVAPFYVVHYEDYEFSEIVRVDGAASRLRARKRPRAEGARKPAHHRRRRDGDDEHDGAGGGRKGKRRAPRRSSSPLRGTRTASSSGGAHGASRPMRRGRLIERTNGGYPASTVDCNGVT